MDEQTETQNAALKRIALFSVGMLVRAQIDDNNSALIPAGSGVVCRLPGDTVVILTAAHVAEEITKYAEAGMYGVPSINPNLTPIEFETKLAGFILFGGGSNGAAGPDLAVIKPPPDKAAWLLSARVPYDIKKRMENPISVYDNLQDTALVGLPTTAYSRMISQEGDRRRDEHVLMVAPGTISNTKPPLDGFDNFEFRCAPGSEVEPETYQGVSGGGIWVFDGDNTQTLPRLAGIAYYQSEKDEHGKRTIYCAGTHAIYFKALQEAHEKWEK